MPVTISEYIGIYRAPNMRSGIQGATETGPVSFVSLPQSRVKRVAAERQRDRYPRPREAHCLGDSSYLRYRRQALSSGIHRGVKIIGATAHIVTDDLDTGPIIAQNVIPVNHTYTATAMVQAGRDAEKIALARAVRLMLDERVFLHGNRSVVFD